MQQFEGDRLENLARTVGDRIFLGCMTTWYGEEENGGHREVEDLIQKAVKRCKMVGFITDARWANDVIQHWGVPTPSPTPSPEPLVP